MRLCVIFVLLLWPFCGLGICSATLSTYSFKMLINLASHATSHGFLDSLVVTELHLHIFILILLLVCDKSRLVRFSDLALRNT